VENLLQITLGREIFPDLAILHPDDPPLGEEFQKDPVHGGSGPSEYPRQLCLIDIWTCEILNRILPFASP